MWLLWLQDGDLTRGSVNLEWGRERLHFPENQPESGETPNTCVRGAETQVPRTRGRVPVGSASEGAASSSSWRALDGKASLCRAPCGGAFLSPPRWPAGGLRPHGGALPSPPRWTAVGLVQQKRKPPAGLGDALGPSTAACLKCHLWKRTPHVITLPCPKDLPLQAAISKSRYHQFTPGRQSF